MGETAPIFLVDKHLRLSALRDRFKGAVVADRPTGSEHIAPDLPFSADKSLRPGIKYPAADGSGQEYVLPTYSIAETGGRFDVRLKWVSPTDAGGPIAQLRIDLAKALPAPTPGLALSEIAHVASARLAFRIPVTGTADDTAAAMLHIELGAVETASHNRATVRLDIHSKGEFDRLWSAMTDPASAARLEIRSFATIGVRTWNQIVSDRIDLADQLQSLAKHGVLLTHPVDPPKSKGEVPFSGRRKYQTGDSLSLRRRMKAERIAREAPDLTSAISRNSVSVANHFGTDTTLARYALNRAFGVRLDLQDLPVLSENPGGGVATIVPKRRIPLRAFVDKKGRPALATMRAECTQPVDFHFDPQVNAYMFDVPGDLRPETTRVFFRHEYAGGGDAALVYYADSAFPGKYYYEPQEFRIPRADASPFLPELRLAFYDLVEEDAEGSDPSEMEILYRVRVAFRALPYVAPAILQGLRRTLLAENPAAELAALVPDDASLALRLPDGFGAMRDTLRESASVSWDDGVIDEFDLTPAELSACIALLQTGAIVGTISGGLPGSQRAGVPVRLSLRETTGTLTDRAYLGPVDEGVARVLLRNRIESPISISALYATPVSGPAIAFPQSLPGATIPPGGSCEIDYKLVPKDTVLLDLDPLASFTIDCDLDQLLPQLMENRGYASESFAVPVSIDPVYFGQTFGPDPRPLAAVRVEFENDATVILAPAATNETATLRLPMLDWLLKRPNAARYRYRVTNLGEDETSGPGATGPWTDGSGEGQLAIVPVGA